MPRIELLAFCCCLASALGCKKDPDHRDEVHDAPTASSSALATGPSGIEQCDAYLEAAARCLAKSPDGEALRANMEQYRQQTAQASSPAEREAVAIGCEVALEALGEDCPPP